MKKLFLTSGVILCMACPAFADLTMENVAYTAEPAAGAHNNSYPAGANDTHPTAAQFSGATIDNACVESAIGVSSGSTTLRAIWEAVYHTITIDSSLAENGDGTPAAPSSLYATAGSIYRDTNFTTGYGSGESPFSTPPVGDTVTYNINFNAGGATVTNADAVLASVSSPAKTLNGFYVYSNDTLGNTAMIDSNGDLTEDGVAADSDQIWKAVWNNVTPTIGVNPTRSNYKFVRWDLNTDDSVDTPGAIGTNTTVYAIWSPYTYTITYSCDTENGGHGANRTQEVAFGQTFNWYGNADTTNCGKVGAHFTGWTCTSGATTFVTNGGVVQHQEDEVDVPHVFDGAQTTASGELWAGLADEAGISCVAKYAANTISLTFDSDNGSQNTTGTCSYGDTVELPTVPTKVGFTFAGWEVVPASASEDNSVYNGE